MSYGSGARNTAYLEADIMSRPREWLIPLLYEHLLSSLRRAEVQIEDNDLMGKAASLEKASAIVIELSSSLDREQGGELAASMSALYAFLLTELLQVGLKRDPVRLRRLIPIVEELLDAWTQAAEQVAPRSAAARSVSISAA